MMNALSAMINEITEKYNLKAVKSSFTREKIAQGDVVKIELLFESKSGFTTQTVHVITPFNKNDTELKKQAMYDTLRAILAVFNSYDVDTQFALHYKQGDRDSLYTMLHILEDRYYFNDIAEIISKDLNNEN